MQLALVLDYTMQYAKFLLALTGLVSNVATSVQANNIWPKPASVTSGNDSTILSRSFSIDIQAPQDATTLNAAAARAKTFLWADNVPELVPGFNATTQTSNTLNKLVVVVKKSNSTAAFATQMTSDVDESYTLKVPAGKGATAMLVANSTAGALHGLTTFTQIFNQEGGRLSLTANRGQQQGAAKSSQSKTTKVYAKGIPMEVSDYPAFPHRGVMVDTSRNYMSLDDLKRTLDAMSWAKLNVLHWHITDAQSWPLQVKGFEKASQYGAYLEDWIYTTANIDEVTKYASDRGIHILMEIDSPGHTSAIAYSNPDLVACLAHDPWTDDANEPPAGQLRIGHPPAEQFLQNYFKSLLPTLPNPFFHTGGDEVNIPCYVNDPIVSAAAKNRSSDGNVTTGVELLLADWVQGLHKVVRQEKKTPIVWEEMLLDHKTGIDKDTWVQVWTSSDNVKAVASQGYKVLTGAADFMYLDCGHGDFLGKNPTGTSWCDPYKTWSKIYSFDPHNSLSDDEKKLVMGGESLIWTEQTDPQNLDRMLWPRAASAAEVYWSYQGGASNVTRVAGLPDALNRLNMWRIRTVNRGVGAEPLQPTWCITRPGQCDLPAQ